MDPFVALMRRYCYDYTCAHDLSQIDKLMSPDYEFTIAGRTLRMEEYRQAVSAAFRRFPTLALTVHEMMLSGDRLAMRFSEHGASGGQGSSVAVWSGISLYRWDGVRLLSCRVEQDFQGRDEQGVSGVSASLEPGHPDPWATTLSEPATAEIEDIVKDWLARYAEETDSGSSAIRLLETSPAGPILSNQSVEIHDMFSAGNRVAASVTFTGEYQGGLPLDDGLCGTIGDLPATLIATVDDGHVGAISLVRDRWGLMRRLKKSS